MQSYSSVLSLSHTSCRHIRSSTWLHMQVHLLLSVAGPCCLCFKLAGRWLGAVRASVGNVGTGWCSLV